MTLSEIILQTKSAKERSLLLFSALKKQPEKANEWHNIIVNAKSPIKASLLEAVEFLTNENPARGKEFLEATIECLNDPAPAVLRESGRIIANVAVSLPDECAEAIPALLNYTKHEGTVVRWAAALALSRIALNHPASAKKLIPLFKKLIENEMNNGVKNHFVKALKKLEK